MKRPSLVAIIILCLSATCGPIVLVAQNVKDSSITLEWSKSEPLPEPRSGYAAGILDGKLVIAGGTYWQGNPGHWTEKMYSASTHAFDPVSHRWQRLPDLPVGLGYAASTVVGKKLFVLGGFTGDSVNHKIFTLQKIGANFSWKLYGSLDVERVFASAVSLKSTIYLIGGATSFEPYDAIGTCCTTNTMTPTLMELDTKRPERGWRGLPSYPGRPRWNPTVATQGGAIWLFGGSFQARQSDAITNFSEVLKYDAKGGTWNVISTLPKIISDIEQPLSSVPIGRKMLLFTRQKRVWLFDAKNQRYIETTAMPESVFIDRLFQFGNKIVGAGGESEIEGPRRRSAQTFEARIVQHD